MEGKASWVEVMVESWGRKVGGGTSPGSAGERRVWKHNKALTLEGS